MTPCCCCCCCWHLNCHSSFQVLKKLLKQDLFLALYLRTWWTQRWIKSTAMPLICTCYWENHLLRMPSQVDTICAAIVSKPRGVVALGKRFYQQQVNLVTFRKPVHFLWPQKSLSSHKNPWVHINKAKYLGLNQESFWISAQTFSWRCHWPRPTPLVAMWWSTISGTKTPRRGFRWNQKLQFSERLLCPGFQRKTKTCLHPWRRKGRDLIAKIWNMFRDLWESKDDSQLTVEAHAWANCHSVINICRPPLHWQFSLHQFG